jgi:hypothetical protein
MSLADRAAKAIGREDGAIPTRFRREVILHLFKNLMPRPDPATPLILGIHGPSGEGKTYQCQRILDELEIGASLVSGGELESSEAGDPAKLIRQRYMAQGRARGVDGHGLTALVFNDIDAAIGSWGDLVQYTVNRQNIFGELMHLADFPDTVEGREIHRVPIILTGNDFSKLYAPLVRAGRMRSLPWTPDSTEKSEILHNIYPELTAAECQELVKRFADQPVAFFAYVRDVLADGVLWGAIDQIGASAAFDELRGGKRPRLNAPVTLGLVTETATHVLRSGKLVNHLRS